MPQFTLKEIARRIRGTIVGDETRSISGPAEIATALPGQITFLANPRYRHFLQTTKASAIIVKNGVEVPSHLSAIYVDDPYAAFVEVIRMFHPPKEWIEPGIHPTAAVDASATLGEDVRVGAYAVIGKNVVIGKGSRIFPHVVIMDDVQIGENCWIYSGVVIREGCEVHNNVIIHSGAIIGSDGFGFAFQEGQYQKIPQVGRVIIESDVEIGANTTIDRATLGVTRVGQGTKIDNLVQIAHNVEIGRHCAIAAQVGISGSTKVGDYCVLGGQVGIAGHIQIGNKVTAAAKAGITKSIPDGETVFGFPARPIQRMRRIEASISQLPEFVKRIRQLENQLEKLLKETGGKRLTNGEENG